MCLYPTLGKNKKYTSNKKNGGVIPAVPDERVKYTPWRCGRCMECKKQEAREWQIRLTEDIKKHKNGKFVTLTFSNESITEINSAIQEEIQGYERDNEIARIGIRRYLERWRKEYKNMKNHRHWFITELGHEGTENIHIHGIIWTNNTFEEIRKIWKYGYIYPRTHQEGLNYVNNRTISYITKYVTKIDKQHTYYNQKIFTTKGIGRNYINSQNARINQEKQTNTYITTTGHEIALPTYYKRLLFNDNEREQKWIELLDTETRYINKIKVSVKNGNDIYNKTLEQAQKKNKKLGYGSNEKNWNRIEYENQQRKLKLAKRIIKNEIEYKIENLKNKEGVTTIYR